LGFYHENGREKENRDIILLKSYIFFLEIAAREENVICKKNKGSLNYV